MFDFLFDLPLLVTGAAIVGSLCLYGLVGLLIVRRYILPRMDVEDADSSFCSAMQQAVMVFYGLAAALIVVNAWQNIPTWQRSRRKKLPPPFSEEKGIVGASRIVGDGQKVSRQWSKWVNSAGTHFLDRIKAPYRT